MGAVLLLAVSTVMLAGVTGIELQAATQMHDGIRGGSLDDERSVLSDIDGKPTFREIGSSPSIGHRGVSVDEDPFGHDHETAGFAPTEESALDSVLNGGGMKKRSASADSIREEQNANLHRSLSPSSKMMQRQEQENQELLNLATRIDDALPRPGMRNRRHRDGLNLPEDARPKLPPRAVQARDQHFLDDDQTEKYLQLDAYRNSADTASYLKAAVVLLFWFLALFVMLTWHEFFAEALAAMFIVECMLRPFYQAVLDVSKPFVQGLKEEVPDSRFRGWGRTIRGLSEFTVFGLGVMMMMAGFGFLLTVGYLSASRLYSEIDSDSDSYREGIENIWCSDFFQLFVSFIRSHELPDDSGAPPFENSSSPTPSPTNEECTLDDFINEDWPVVQGKFLEEITAFFGSLVGNTVWILGFCVIYVIFVVEIWPPASKQLLRSYSENKSILAVSFGVAQGLVLTPFLGLGLAPAFGIMDYVLYWVPEIGPAVACFLPVIACALHVDRQHLAFACMLVEFMVIAFWRVILEQRMLETVIFLTMEPLPALFLIFMASPLLGAGGMCMVLPLAALLRLLALSDNAYLRNLIGMPVLHFLLCLPPGECEEKTKYLTELTEARDLAVSQQHERPRCCNWPRKGCEFLCRAFSNICSGRLVPSVFRGFRGRDEQRSVNGVLNDQLGNSLLASDIESQVRGAEGFQSMSIDGAAGVGMGDSDSRNSISILGPDELSRATSISVHSLESTDSVYKQMGGAKVVDL